MDGLSTVFEGGDAVTERQVNLEGVPEPIARAIEIMAQTARKLAANDRRKERPRVELPVWNLGVKGPLRREDYYDDAK
jgi:hypothetical protein